LQALGDLEKLETKHLDSLYKIRLRNELMNSVEFINARRGRLSKEKDDSTAFEKWLSESGGQGINAKSIGRTISEEDVRSLITPHAAGGIFASPHVGMIAEAGPEAVIPLKAMGTSSARQPAKFGGEPARRLVNFAARGGQQAGQQAIRVVAGDVYLDGRIVGRHLVRELLSAEA
jgi:hypothetical protein